MLGGNNPHFQYDEEKDRPIISKPVVVFEQKVLTITA